MAVRSAIQYIAHYILRECKLATYVPTSVAAAATSLRVLDVSIFDPAGGQVIVEDIDGLIIYTNIQDDSLAGIPASGTGSISATINPYTSASRDLLYRADMISAYELERFIDRYKVWVDGVKCLPDVEKKRYSARRPGWFDTGVSLRDDDDDSYNSVTADTISYEEGVFEFTTARTDNKLFCSGWTYNPFLTIADMIEEAFSTDARWATWSQLGGMAEGKKDASDRANIYRKRGAVLNFIT
jgi:hypothetical protein